MRHHSTPLNSRSQSVREAKKRIKMWECHSLRLMWMLGSHINQCLSQNCDCLRVSAAGCDFRRSDRFLMKENTFHYLCNVRTSPSGFRCCEKWIRLYAKLLIKAFRGSERRRQKREERRTDYTNCVSLKHHFTSSSQHRQWKMRKTKLKGLHFPNWGFANVAEKCFYSFSSLVFPFASFSSADA